MNTTNNGSVTLEKNAKGKNNPEAPKPESVTARVARVDALVTNQIKSSHANADGLLTAICESVLLAADTGIANYEPLNRLWNGVSVGDKAAIGAFFRRFTPIEGYNFKTVNDSGKESVNTFLKFTTKAGFFPYPAEKGSDNHKLIVKIRNRVMESGVNGLRTIGFGSGQNESRTMEREFDAVEASTRFLSQLIRNGMRATAFSLQREMESLKIPVSKAVLEQVANDADPDKKIERATKALEKAQAAKARMVEKANSPIEQANA